MIEDVNSDNADLKNGQILLGLLPPFLRRELIDDQTFRHAIGFEAGELITFGSQTKFPRPDFFQSVIDVFESAGRRSEIVDLDQKTWTLKRKEITNDRVVLQVSNDEESFLVGEFFVFLPDTSDRLREFDIAIREHGFPETGLSEWRSLLQKRVLTEEEMGKLSREIAETPVAFMWKFREKILAAKVSAEDMVPNNLAYFENLCGAGDANNLPDLVAETVSHVVANYLGWDDEEGPRMALLLCSHPLISEQIANSEIDGPRLLNLAKWVLGQGDVFAKIGFVEIALPALQNWPDLECYLVEIIEEILEFDTEDKGGALHLFMSFIVLVESEVSRTRVLSHWPPFRRRLATISHAALLVRESTNRIDVSQLSTWIMKNHGLRFYLQNLIDLQSEPGWLPDYVDPNQLKQEMLGRLNISYQKVAGSIRGGPIRDMLDPEKTESKFNKIRTLKSQFPGPLEGAESSLRNPVPSGLEEILDQNLTGEKLKAQSVSSLINISILFRVESEKAERAVEIIKASNFRFAEEMEASERAFLIYGLSVAASQLRSQSLARSVRALSRTYRGEGNKATRYSEDVVVALLAAGAFEDFDDWRSFLGDLLNELCFHVNKGETAELENSLEMICSIEPRLRSKLGASLSALASIK